MAKKPILSRPLKKQTMAEQMAETIQELIISGELAGGAALPTEPELAEQFGVSRAVVRDATRILMARGLVEVKHGLGVFVTQPTNEAFGEALLLALRRAGATVWDVQQFEQIIFPEAIALAAVHASAEEVAAIRQLAEDYLATVASHHTKWWGKEPPAADLEGIKTAYRRIMQAIFAATHNQVFRQLAQPLLTLRNMRDWAETEDSSPEEVITLETYYLNQLVEAIAGRDPDQARAIVARLMTLPSEAVEAMRRTPAGEIVKIPVPLPKPPTL